MGLHAKMALGEDPDAWDQESRDYLDALIKPVSVELA